MKSINSQRGRSHTIIIVLLVVLIIGVLGYVAWLNFVAQPADESDTAQSTTQDADVDESEESYLGISVLGIKVPYIASVDTYTVGEPNEFGSVSVYSSVAADAGCIYGDGSEPAGFIGSISSLPSNEDQRESSDYLRKVIIEDTAYTVMSPQNSCGSSNPGEDNPAGEAQEAAFLRFADQFEKLEVL